MEATSQVRQTAMRQAGCLTRAQALAAGLPPGRVQWLVECGEWVTLATGVYMVDAEAADVASLPFATRLHAALLAAGPGAAACLGTAAELHGLPVPARRASTVELVLPPGRELSQPAHAELHFRRLDHASLTSRVAPDAPDTAAVPCTSLLQTVADTVCVWSEWDAVSLVDAALGSSALPDGWEADLDRLLWRKRGAVAARRRLECADARAQSPLETRVRLIAADAGLAPDHLQYEVRDHRGILLGFGDLAWNKPGGRVLVAECDGRIWHEAPAALLHDRRRSNSFVGVGDVDIVRFSWEDTLRPAYICSVLRGHLGAASQPRAG